MTPFLPPSPLIGVQTIGSSSSVSVLARSPNLNAHGERFVRSIKEEALEQMVMLGERSLYYVIQQYLTHYHTEPTIIRSAIIKGSIIT